MTKSELFKKYSINESHNIWESVDSWASIEIHRLMHGGELPTDKDKSILWLLDFLDKPKKDMKWWANNVLIRDNWGSLFLTAKRMLYILSDKELEEINH